MAGDEDKKSAQLSCRITIFQDETIEALKEVGVFGKERSDVVRALLQLAIDRLMETGQVQRLREWRKSLKE